MFSLTICTTGASINGRAGYGAVLTADGQNPIILSNYLGEYKKNQADVISITMALRAVKPQYRDNVEVLLYVPPAYAAQCVHRNESGWIIHPKANLEIVTDARNMIEKFSMITIEKGTLKIDGFAQALKVAKEACVN